VFLDQLADILGSVAESLRREPDDRLLGLAPTILWLLSDGYQRQRAAKEGDGKMDSHKNSPFDSPG
jgi:hypothetical protein